MFWRGSQEPNPVFPLGGNDSLFTNSQFSSVQLLSRVRLVATPWTAAHQASLSIANSWSLLNSGPLSQWWHPTVSSSVVALLLLPSVFPSLRVFANESVLRIRWPKSWNFSFSIVPMNIQDWFPLGCTGLISLQSKGLSRLFSNTTVQRHQFFSAQLSL